jgi:hypothetical protein
MMIVNDDSRVITKLETSLTDDTRVVIYDHHMYIIQATDHRIKGNNFGQRHLLSPVACTINVYDRKFYDRKLRLSLEHYYDCTIVILAKHSLNYDHSLRS